MLIVVGEPVAAQTDAFDRSSELLLFLSGEYLQRFGTNTTAWDSTEFTPAADLLYSRSNGAWRMMAEYLVTDEESELERLQLSYSASEEATILTGRFHTPASAWVSKYHHGRFLQSSITRPAIEEWEDDGGVIPAHISGIMIEQGIPLAAGNGTRVAIAVGAGPYIKNRELRPFDLLNPGRGENALSASLTISYFPDYVAGVNLGLSLSNSQIVVLQNPSLGIAQEFDINQWVVGLQMDWRKKEWQILAASYHVDNHSEDSNRQYGGSFVSGYAELQRSGKGRSTAYLRGEFSKNAASADYLRMFPDYVTDRLVAGLRFDILDNQAVTVEVSDQDSLQDDFRALSIQWSSVFP